ncbi:MAG TPA: hypothetical protein VFQ91_10540 [Bryobacteraceae bacterium]|nr:hypothetical protein [Bryobacteraceae bacterium]
MFGATFYRWRINYYIQIDPRYQNDPAWGAAAKCALWNYKETALARREGLISTKPPWVERAQL